MMPISMINWSGGIRKISVNIGVSGEMNHRLFPKANSRSLLFPRREDVVTPEDVQWQDLIRGGTIPTAASLRVPPARIGMSTRSDKLLGVTNQEVSKRYMAKLQRDRERTNQLVSKSLSNLPIKIKQLMVEQTNPTVIQEAIQRARKNGMCAIRKRDYEIGLGNRSDEDNTSHLFQALPINSLCKHTKRNCSKCHKQIRGKKSKKREDTELIDSRTLPTDRTDTKTSGYDSDLEIFGDFGSDRFQQISTHALHGLPFKSNLKPVFKRQEILDELDDFRNPYQKVLDANRTPHFVHTSLVNGKRVKRLNNISSKPKFRNISLPEYTRTSSTFSVQPVQSLLHFKKQSRGMEQNSPIFPSAPHQSLMSAGTDYQNVFVNLSDYTDSEEEEIALSESGDEELLKANLPQLGKRESVTIKSKQNSAGADENEFTTVEDDLSNSVVVRLSASSLQVHNSHGDTTKTMTPIKHGGNVCKLTDITEREESNLTQTTRKTRRSTESENLQNMKMSVRIAYKNGLKDNIQETSNMSEEIVVPRWSHREKTQETDSFEDTIKERTDDNDNERFRQLENMGYPIDCHNELKNIYKESIKDIADTIDEAKRAMDFIDQTLANKDQRVSGQEITPAGDDMDSEMNSHLRTVISNTNENQYREIDNKKYITGDKRHVIQAACKDLQDVQNTEKNSVNSRDFLTECDSVCSVIEENKKDSLKEIDIRNGDGKFMKSEGGEKHRKPLEMEDSELTKETFFVTRKL